MPLSSPSCTVERGIWGWNALKDLTKAVMIKPCDYVWKPIVLLLLWRYKTLRRNNVSMQIFQQNLSTFNVHITNLHMYYCCKMDMHTCKSALKHMYMHSSIHSIVRMHIYIHIRSCVYAYISLNTHAETYLKYTLCGDLFQNMRK